jgi:hypothetical protein
MDLPSRAKSDEIGEDRPKSAELAHKSAHNEQLHRTGVLHRKGVPDTRAIERERRRFLPAYALATRGLLSKGLAEILPAYPEAGAASPYIDLWSAVEYDHPELFRALSTWAEKFLLTFSHKPAPWAMEAALGILRLWKRPNRLSWPWPWQYPWRHSAEMHEEYLAYLMSDVPGWDPASGETEQEFKRRLDAERDRFFESERRARQEWTERLTVEEPLYTDGLAMWQAALNLSQIHDRLTRLGLEAGPPGKDRNSKIQKGLRERARLIQLDRRPPTRRR